MPKVWFEAKFLINGLTQSKAKFFPRSDVEAAFPDLYASGFALVVELASLELNNQKAIVFQAVVDGESISTNLFRFAPQIAAARGTTLFIHTPKCGGTSIKKNFDNNLEHVNTIFLYDGVAGAIAEPDFRLLKSDTLDETDSVFGHFSYGLHEVFSKNVRYCSFIRHPSKFAVSYFNFSRSSATTHGESDLLDLLEHSDDPHYNNMFTRMFSGYNEVEAPTRSELELAKENITRHFDFIGLQEKVSASCSAFERQFGIKFQAFHENRSDQKLNAKSFGIERKISEKLALDIELFEFVIKRFWI